MDCTLFPDVKDFFDVFGEKVANDGSADISLLDEGITHGLNNRVTLLHTSLEVGEEVCQGLAPVCGRSTGILVLIAEIFSVSQARQVAIVD